jgi:hypothetical protein
LGRSGRGSSTRGKIRTQFRGEQPSDNLGRGLDAHVEYFSAVLREIRIRLMEKSLHRPGEARGDLYGSLASETFQGRIPPGRHFTQIRNGFERHARFAETAEHRLLDLSRNGLSVLTMAIKNPGRGGSHERQFARYQSPGTKKVERRHGFDKHGYVRLETMPLLSFQPPGAWFL